MLPIYVMYDSGLNLLERSSVEQAISDLRFEMPERRIESYGHWAWSKGDYGCADWYIQTAGRIIKSKNQVQLDAESLLGLLEREPWQEKTPHIDVLFTSRDLSARGLNFCFGMTRGRCTVQSVYRYRSLNSSVDRSLAIKTVLWHELGHVFGLAVRANNSEYKLGWHCTNHGCAMRQGMNLTEWVKNTRELKAAGRIYCPQCLADLHKTVI